MTFVISCPNNAMSYGEYYAVGHVMQLVYREKSRALTIAPSLDRQLKMEAILISPCSALHRKDFPWFP